METFPHAYVYMQIHVYTQAHMDRHTHTHVHTSAHTRTHAHTHTRTHTHTMYLQRFADQQLQVEYSEGNLLSKMTITISSMLQLPYQVVAVDSVVSVELAITCNLIMASPYTQDWSKTSIINIYEHKFIRINI